MTQAIHDIGLNDDGNSCQICQCHSGKHLNQDANVDKIHPDPIGVLDSEDDKISKMINLKKSMKLVVAQKF
jgi:hypothetical protein